MKVSPTLRGALLALLEGDKLPWELYKPMFPRGRFNTDYDHGSAGGGPSRTECAVNWYLGKHARNLVRRTEVCGMSGEAVAQGAYTLTSDGRRLAERLNVD